MTTLVRVSWNLQGKRNLIEEYGQLFDFQYLTVRFAYHIYQCTNLAHNSFSRVTHQHQRQRSGSIPLLDSPFETNSCSCAQTSSLQGRHGHTSCAVNPHPGRSPGSLPFVHVRDTRSQRPRVACKNIIILESSVTPTLITRPRMRRFQGPPAMKKDKRP